jgi:hypothetical protein
MLKALVVSAALTIFMTVSAATAFAAQTTKSQVWAEKRGHCITEARGVYMSDKGRGFRSRFRACMTRD